MTNPRQQHTRLFRNDAQAAGIALASRLLLLVILAVAPAVLLAGGAYAQTVTFSYKLSCNIFDDPQCPKSNLTVATQVGQVAGDLVSIAAVSSDVPGYTNPAPVSGGALSWISSPATIVQCALSLRPDSCGATYGNAGGNASLIGSVFGLPSGSTLLSASFQGGATSSYQSHTGNTNFYGRVSVSYVNPLILSNLGLAGLPNDGVGFLSDTFVPADYTGVEYFVVSVTFTTGNLHVIHNFTGGTDGLNPVGLTMGAAGNLYGTTFGGGSGYGTVTKLVHQQSGWLFNSLYSFKGGNDGADPYGRVIVGPGGVLLGTTRDGGACSQRPQYGCGTVFMLRPPDRACNSPLCPWSETVLYRFNGGSDGELPTGDIVFDQAGNLYGTTYAGGGPGCDGSGCGAIYKLTPSNGSWTESVIYSFAGDSDGETPMAGLAIDQAGSLYATTPYGGASGHGTVLQLTPSGSSWTANVLHTFAGGSDGGGPAGLILDRSGNLYGATDSTIFALTFSGGNWVYSVTYDGTGANGLARDGADNVYGTTGGGPYGAGNIFKLTPSNGAWIYTLLYDFTGGSDGGGPSPSVVFDNNGHLYGTAAYGGANGDGVVFELPLH
jgi:uncharacterized repeat protein (TIGR03803 family)